jgi:predicted chitinase
MNAAFYDAVRESVFGGSMSQPQVEGIEIIQEAWEKAGDGDPYKFAYILATAFHETARTMQPVRETLAKTDAKAKEILTKAWRAGKLPWVKKDYWSSGWFGRGYVQLTHRENYEKAGKELGIDLVKDPSKAMIPEVAALILVRGCMEGWFTQRKLSHYITRSDADYIGARRVVNGTDRAGDIAEYATDLYRAIAKAKEAPKPAPKPVAPPIPETPVSEARKPSAGWIILIATAVAAGVTAAWEWIVQTTGLISPWW